MLRLLVLFAVTQSLLAVAACTDSDATTTDDASVDGGGEPADAGDAAVRDRAAEGSVSFNLAPDVDCTYDASPASLFLPVGLYDLLRRDDATDHACDQSYKLHLLTVASRQPDTSTTDGATLLQLHSASVTLTTIEGETLRFDAGAQPLPNPFQITTSASLALPTDGSPARGIATVEAIPLAYAAQLTPHVGDQIIAEVQLFGTTTDDEDLASEPFIYPIELCSGCLILCTSELQAASMTREDAVGDDCPDQAGADGRVCVEPDC